MNYLEFLQMLCLLASPRLAELDDLSPSPLTPDLFPGLRLFVCKAVSDCQLDFFGKRRHQSGSEGLVPGAVADRFSKVVKTCSHPVEENFSRVRCLLDRLPDMARTLVTVEDANMLERALRVYELHQIDKVMTEMSNDTDMQAVAVTGLF